MAQTHRRPKQLNLQLAATSPVMSRPKGGQATAQSKQHAAQIERTLWSKFAVDKVAWGLRLFSFGLGL